MSFVSPWSSLFVRSSTFLQHFLDLGRHDRLMLLTSAMATDIVAPAFLITGFVPWCIIVPTKCMMSSGAVAGGISLTQFRSCMLVVVSPVSVLRAKACFVHMCMRAGWVVESRWGQRCVPACSSSNLAALGVLVCIVTMVPTALCFPILLHHTVVALVVVIVVIIVVSLAAEPCLDLMFSAVVVGLGLTIPMEYRSLHNA
jgi:hypothetical protein